MLVKDSLIVLLFIIIIIFLHCHIRVVCSIAQISLLCNAIIFYSLIPISFMIMTTFKKILTMTYNEH